MSHSFQHIIWSGEILLGLATALFGDFNQFMLSFAIMMTLDLVSRLIVAADQGTISSKKLKRGTAKKVLYLVVLAAFYNVGQILGIPITVRNWLIAIFVFSEFVSIIENVTMVGEEDVNYIPLSVVSFAESILSKHYRERQFVPNQED